MTSFPGTITEFASTSAPAYPPKHRARPGAPNVVVFLIDDLGFSDIGAFGSEIPTPNIDKLAAGGWQFNNYHTEPLCSPARAALLTGMHPHRVGFGMVAHADPGYPGYSCQLPVDTPTLAETLRSNGYATFMVGKWHLTLESNLHDAADKSTWPLQRGFDHYYGPMDGFTSLHHPHRLVHDNTVSSQTEFDADYYLTDDLTERACGMVDDLRVNDPEKPFFLYFAHTAVHGPVQAKAATIERFRGHYAKGWDVIRQRRFARQQELGIIAEHATLPDDPADGIPAWESLSPDEQALYATHMEVYAAAVSDVDDSVGQVMTHLRELGEYENTIFVFASDNGGTAEGGPSGTRSYFAQFATGPGLPDDWVADVPRPLQDIGGPRVHGHYPAGWARVSNTPFRSFKGSLYEGGIHSPLILSWAAAPDTTTAGFRDQLLHVSDIAPTVCDLIGVTPNAHRHGHPAQPVDGTSFAEVLSNAHAPVQRVHHYETSGRRALIDPPYKVVSDTPPQPVDGAAGGAWELYELTADPTETTDLSLTQPQRLQQLTSQWVELGWELGVFPMNNDASHFIRRPSSELVLAQPVRVPAFRPPLERFRSAKLTVLRSFDVHCRVTIDTTTSGVIVAHGDQGGGYLLGLDQATPFISYNAYGAMHRAHGAALTQGTHTLTFSFTELPDLRWRVSVTSETGAELCSIDTVPMLLGMAPFTGISVGYDYGGPVDWELHEAHRTFPFTGTIDEVRYVPGKRSAADLTLIHHIDTVVRAVAE